MKGDIREHFQKLLGGTEMERACWVKQQLRLIELVGLQNYLETQMGSSNPAP